MTQSPLEPLILRLAVPAIVSNLVTVTYNMADTWFIGRLGTSQSGAVGVAFSVMTIMQAIGFFFGQGGGNSLSRELGKRNEERASRLLSVAFFGSVGFGVLLGVLGLLILQPLVHGLGATDTIAPYAVQYLTPLLVATPCVTGSFTMNGLLRFQGLSAYSMIGLVTGAILNIALAPALIFGAGLGIFGAGLATAICQTISFTILTVMCVKVGVVRLSPRWFQPDMLLIREMIGGGLPSLLRNGVGSVAVTCVNLAANPFGDAAIAAMAIVNRIALTANSMIVGFGQGFQPVCGYNYGAGLFARVRRGFWFGVRVETAILVCATVVFVLFAPELVGLFRADPDVIRIGEVALRLQCCTLWMNGFNMMSNMSQQTMGRTLAASILGVARQGLFLVPLVWLLPAILPAFGLPALLGIQMAQPISDLLTFAITVPIQLRMLRGLKTADGPQMTATSLSSTMR
ncbi:MATE family efflux transporter [Bifidobacterium pullorum]|uniref:MATE family efflux transporter n=1 Tax=Bifidobacterium pullorum TaxID=78448 RepID=UPI00307C5004